MLIPDVRRSGMKDVKVCAIVVLYNNLEEIKSITEALLKQTKFIEQIIYVDNSHIEFTYEIRNYLKSISNRNTFLYYRTKRNLGSAGGYALGMEIALKSEVDFVWLNDQDGIPSTTCLNNLIEEYRKHQKECIYAPKIISIEENKELRNFRSKVNSFLNPYNPKEARIENIIDIVGTTGVMIHKKVIENIGVYNNNICFVGNEDKEYSLRAKNNGIEIIIVKESIYYHPDLSIKYKRKTSIIDCMPYIRKFLPLYLGAVYTGSERTIASTISSAYINKQYGKPGFKQINYFYSVLKTLVKRIIDQRICIQETLSSYRKGDVLGRNTNVLYRVKDWQSNVELYECFDSKLEESV